jgi:hypothetical protein
MYAYIDVCERCVHLVDISAINAVSVDILFSDIRLIDVDYHRYASLVGMFLW